MNNSVAQLPVAPRDRVNVAEAIRAHLAVAGISATKMAVMIGLSQSAMSRRTKAQQPFDIDELSAIGNTLNKTLEEVIQMPERSLSDYSSVASIINMADFRDTKTQPASALA